MKKYIFLSLSLLLFFVSCKKLERDNPLEVVAPLPTVFTNPIVNTNPFLASCGGNITADGGTAVTSRGVCWSTAPNPSITDSHTTDGIGIGAFVSNITGLSGITQYYVRAYATNVNGTAYGNQVTFTTPPATSPTVTTNSVTSITSNSATCGGNVTNAGTNSVTARGVCWNTSPNPTTSNSNTTNGTGTGAFSTTITGLTASTVYYVRAYATNVNGTAYGNQVTFTFTPTVPVLTTTAVSSITTTTAISGGNVTSDGGASVTARGVCWSTSSNPVATGNHTTNGTGTGIFTSNITSLLPSTTYYVRAYATNSAGTAYGNVRSFTTGSLAIGDSYQGGIIAYILQFGDFGYNASVQHGLIATTSNQSTGTIWYNGSYVTTGATATYLAAGNLNTNTIVNIQGAGNYAAKLCYDLVLNGYSDWFLPSKDELNKLYLNQTAIGGFANAGYWGSTEDDNNYAWYQSFTGGYQGISLKSDAGYVRAVRAF